MNNIKKLPTKKGSGPYNFPVELYQAFKDELILILQSSSKKNRKEWILLYSSCCCCSLAKTCLTVCHPMDCSMPGSILIQCQYYLHTETTQRHHKEIKLQANISHGYGYKTFNKIVANYIQQHMNGIIHQTTVQFMSSMQGWSGNQLIQCTILIFIQWQDHLNKCKKLLTKSNILS